MKVNLVFVINNHTKIYFETMDQDNDFYLDEDIQIIFQYKKDRYILEFSCICSLLKTFIENFKLALNKELFLHESIDKNIGFMANEKYQKDLDEWYGNDNSFLASPGYARPKVSTWLYNDKGSDDIVLEITEDYPWTFMEPEEGEKFIEYEEFIKDYTSLFVFKLSRKQVEEWLKIVTEASDLLYKDAGVSNQ